MIAAHRRIIQHIDTRLSLPLQWQAMNRGLTNELYQAIDPDTDQVVYVLRINRDELTTHGINRQHELQILNQLCHLPFMPDIIHADPGQNWLLMQAYTPIDDDLDDTQTQALIHAIDALQRIAPQTLDLPYFDYHQLMLAYFHDAQHLKQNLHTDITEVLHTIQQFKAHFAQLPDVLPYLTHHDLHLGNLCIAHQGSSATLKIIDWEYAALGCPWFDAWGLIHHCGLRAEVVKTLPAFTQLSDTQWQSGLRLTKILTQKLDALWYWRRAYESHLDMHLANHQLR